MAFCIVENPNSGNLSVINTDNAPSAIRQGFFVHPGTFQTRQAAEELIIDEMASRHEQMVADAEVAADCGCDDLDCMGGCRS